MALSQPLSPPDPGWTLTTAALSSSISALGGSDCSAQGIVQMQKLAFPSLDEPMLIEMRLRQRQRTQQRHRLIARAVGAGVGMATGMAIDGFDMGDLGSAFMGGVVGDVTAEALNGLSDAELDKLDLRWAVAPDSLQFHQRRHGRPLHRVLLMRLSDNHLRTTCAVRFSDGFLAFFARELFQCELAPFDGTRRLSGNGAMPESSAQPRTVGELPCSDGRSRPFQAVMTDQGPLLAMEFVTPHHSLY